MPHCLGGDDYLCVSQDVISRVLPGINPLPTAFECKWCVGEKELLCCAFSLLCGQLVICYVHDQIKMKMMT